MKSNGFVLGMTLILLTIISCTLLYWLDAVWLYRKASFMMEQIQQDRYDLETNAFRLMNLRGHYKRSECIIAAGDPTEILRHIKSLKACQISSGRRHFNYIIENLGSYPCHMLQTEVGWKGSHHWRISMIENKAAAMGLQLRYVSPEPIDIPCENHDLREIHGHILSYRYINVDLL